METIRDVAPAASSGALAGVVGYGWGVGRAAARGVVGAAGGWVAWALVGLLGCAVLRQARCTKMCSGELGGRESNVRAGIGVGTTGGEP